MQELNDICHRLIVGIKDRERGVREAKGETLMYVLMKMMEYCCKKDKGMAQWQPCGVGA